MCLDVGDGAACAFLAVGEGAATAVSYEPAEWSHLLVGQVSGWRLHARILVREGRRDQILLKNESNAFVVLVNVP